MSLHNVVPIHLVHMKTLHQIIEISNMLVVLTKRSKSLGLGLGAMDVRTKFYGKPSDSCEDISVWTKVFTDVLTNIISMSLQMKESWEAVNFSQLQL